jgi:aminoglycoside phosphotransferase (APT) family kinase protein
MTPNQDAELRSRLESFLTQKAGAPVTVTAARRLTGGASRETWAIDIDLAGGRQALVLRRDMGGEIQEEALSRRQEFALLVAAHEAGVLVPRPRWLCDDPSVLGTPFFLMDRLEGESVGRRIVREPAFAEARRMLPKQMGEQLALIHRLAVTHPAVVALPQPSSGTAPSLAALERATQQLWKLGEPHPALELAARWLRQQAPQTMDCVLVHGDFRIGNWMIGPEGLRGVFDWEFAHVSDPAEDLAWPCVRSWRFGQDQLRFGGVGEAEEFFAAYEQASGRTIDRRAIAFWEMLGNFRWAVGCIQQAHRHLSGQAASIELASLGRRTAEMELELLDLIERAPHPCPSPLRGEGCI